MKLKQLFADEDAVSPVIGVILMVAITVILAAVIGTFVLGLGNEVQQTSPTASFSFDYDGAGDGFTDSDNNDEVTITHDGGDTIESSKLAVKVDGAAASDNGDLSDPGWSGDVSAGDTVTISESAGGALQSGYTVKVVWTSDDGSNSATLGEGEIP